MIDVFKCKFEDVYDSPGGGFKIFYYSYPVDMTIAEFDVEPSDNVVSMCVSLTVNAPIDPVEVAVSPTVESEDGFSDVDWHNLEIDINDILYLLSLATNHIVLHDVLGKRLVDDDSPYGGTSFIGETVRDFIRSINKEFYSLEELNAVLKECGIKPVSP